MARALACLLLLALGSPVLGADEVWLVRYVDDMPLADAVKETAAHLDLDVEVERALARKRVTVQLEDPIVGAIQKLAAAAGGHLWKLAEGRYAIRRKPPPASAVPPRAELEGPEPEGELLPEPAWARAIWRALETTPYEGAFRGTPLPAFLAALAKQANVPFHLDPAVVQGRSKRDLRVDFEDPLGNLSVREALLLFCGTRDLTHTVRWGVLFVTTRVRLDAMPVRVFVGEAGASPDALPEAVAEVLATHRVTCALKRASVAKAVAALTRNSGLEIAIDPAAAKHVRRRTFTDAFAGRALGDALALLLVPAGLGLRVEDGALEVTLR